MQTQSLCNRCIYPCKDDEPKALCMRFKSVDDKGHRAEDRARLRRAINQKLKERTGIAPDEEVII